MGLVSPQQSNPNDEITADAINVPVNQLASVINGQLDDFNISSLSGSKLGNGTLTNAKLSTTAGEPGAAWTSFSGLGISSATGTISSGSAAGTYFRIGSLIVLNFAVTIANNGSGGGSVKINLSGPYAAKSGSIVSFYGRADAVSGKQLQGKITGSTGVVDIFNYDNTYPGATGEVLRCTAIYEAA